ncbi:MAG: aminotransferase class IV [Bacteroidales bacterium]|nr:aminotransferase class IV [Bacteroidales bacterium]
MNKTQYISYNGQIIAAKEFGITMNNRSFQYGDGLFETMHAVGSQVQFFYEHIERLVESMKVLKMEVPVRFTIDTLGLQNEISKLLTKNKIFKGGRVRLTVFRRAGGLYTPKTSEVSYIVQVLPLEQTYYELNKKGYIIDIFDEIPKPVNILSGIKSTSSLLYVLAGVYRKENKLDECLLINELGNIVEGMSSNIFLIKEGNIYTPPLRSGCLNGIMRKKVINLAKSEGFTVFDEVPIKLPDIMAADELFFTNAINGIRWVMGFKQRRYFNKITKLLSRKLNEKVFAEYGIAY